MARDTQLSDAEETALKESADGAKKAAMLGRLTKAQLDNVLGSRLVDDDGNPYTAAEKAKYRDTKLKRLYAYDNADNVRAELNVESVAGKSVVFSDIDDYTAHEKALIAGAIESANKKNSGLQIPRGIVNALDTSKLFTALRNVCRAAATDEQINELIVELRKL